MYFFSQCSEVVRTETYSQDVRTSKHQKKSQIRSFSDFIRPQTNTASQNNRARVLFLASVWKDSVKNATIFTKPIITISSQSLRYPETVQTPARISSFTFLLQATYKKNKINKKRNWKYQLWNFSGTEQTWLYMSNRERPRLPTTEEMSPKKVIMWVILYSMGWIVDLNTVVLTERGWPF